MKLKVYETKNYFGLQKEDQLRHKIGYINKNGWLNASDELKEILSKLNLNWESGNPISVGDTIVTLDWFDSYPVPVVQETTIYLKKYFAGSTTQPADEYTPSSLDRKWSKRIVGPFSPSIVGDTITVYAEIYWDGGSRSKSKILEQKIIIE